MHPVILLTVAPQFSHRCSHIYIYLFFSLSFCYRVTLSDAKETFILPFSIKTTVVLIVIRPNCFWNNFSKIFHLLHDHMSHYFKHTLNPNQYDLEHFWYPVLILFLLQSVLNARLILFLLTLSHTPICRTHVQFSFFLILT